VEFTYIRDPEGAVHKAALASGLFTVACECHLHGGHHAFISGRERAGVHTMSSQPHLPLKNARLWEGVATWEGRRTHSSPAIVNLGLSE
jgi:hypothetical protein